MSRSYKKTPTCKCGGYGKDGKKFAKRKWRRTVREDDVSGRRSLYKRDYNSWEIYDWINRWTREEAIRYYNDMKNASEGNINNNYRNWCVQFIKKYPTEESFLKEKWEKDFRRK